MMGAVRITGIKGVFPLGENGCEYDIYSSQRAFKNANHRGSGSDDYVAFSVEGIVEEIVLVEVAQRIRLSRSGARR